MGVNKAIKSALFLVALLLFASCFLVNVNAQYVGNQPYYESITPRSVPKFTVEVTGSGTVNVTITNQVSVLTINGVDYQTYFSIRHKEHQADTWTQGSRIAQTNDSKYTVVKLSFDYPNNTQVDIQAQAMLGGYTSHEPASGSPFIPDYSEFGVPVDSMSSWSESQTVTLTEYTPTVTTTPSPPSDLLSELNWLQTMIILLALLVAGSWIAIIVLWRKRTAK